MLSEKLLSYLKPQFLMCKVVGDNADLWGASPFTSHLNSHANCCVTLMHFRALWPCVYICPAALGASTGLGQSCQYLLAVECSAV